MQRRIDNQSEQQAGAVPRLAVDRLQGTDGIRRQTALSGDPRLGGLTPLQAYLERDLITEQFMELYCYCHVASLVESGAARPGAAIVVGYDPRDPSRRFVEAVLAGVRKAGATAVDVGILPTPAVALYMVARNAAGAIVITASHNGPDQNGIKLFLRAQGLKLFPADDRRLTQAVRRTSYDEVAALPCVGEYLDEHAEAVEVCRRFCLEPRNSWLGDEAPATPDKLRNLVLVVDTANGALSELAAPILAELGAETIAVNTSLAGDVNLDSGVADLEGTAIITAAMVYEADGPFARHAALRRLFAEGRRRRAAVQRGQVRVVAAVFDADGDRFYAVEYDAFEDRLLVLSGDEIACHQAAYLLRRHGEAWRGSLFVNTVESDLHAARHAAALGFSTALTAVGDKWVLLRALRAYLRALADAATPEQPAGELAELRRRADALTTDPDVVGARLGRLLTQVAAKAATAAALLQPGAIPFAVGSEETGHCITTGFLRCQDGRELPVFLGNGLKSAINTFAATQWLLRDCGPRERLARLAHPFAPGHKRTSYAYYTRKAEFHRGSPLWVAVEEVLRRQLEEVLCTERQPLALRRLEFAEEPDMLYLGVYDVEERLVAGVFVRNSGTEDKTGVNVRGSSELARLLDDAGEEALRLLLRRLKDPSHPCARAERRILAHLVRLAEGAGEQAEAGGAGCDEAALRALLADEGGGVSLGRLLHEMEAKQGLLRRTPHGYALTARGAWYAGACGEE